MSACKWDLFFTCL